MILGLFGILFPVVTLAAYNAGDILLGGANNTADTAGVDVNGPEVQDLVGTIIAGALTLVGVLFFILMLYGGITWMLARGNEEYTKRALNTIVAAIIGLIVVAASYVITKFVFDSVATPSTTPENTPGCCVLIDGGTGEFAADSGTQFSCQGDAANNIIAEFYPSPAALSVTSQYCQSNCRQGNCSYQELIERIPTSREAQS